MMTQFEKMAFQAVLDAQQNHLLPLPEPLEEVKGVYEISSIRDETEEMRRIKVITESGVFYVTVVKRGERIFDVKLGSYRYIYEV